MLCNTKICFKSTNDSNKSLIHLFIKGLKIKYQTKSNIAKDKKTTHIEEELWRKQNERIVSKNIAIEKNKPVSESSIFSEYTQKVILYGYLMVRAILYKFISNHLLSLLI